ncbi:MAG: hypothetical protein M3Q44_07980 [bacterium]|nr:hypothetical protein [bacterium]
MDMHIQIITNIIKEQRFIIGPLAIAQANKVPGLHIEGTNEIKIEGDGKIIIQGLVERYSKLFGQASIQICKEAIEPLLGKIQPQDLPDILKN